MLASEATDDIILLLDSPDQCTSPPDLHHAGLIPPAMRQSLQGLRQQARIPIPQIRFYRMRQVYVIEQGLIYDRKFRLVQASRTQHNEAELARGQWAIRRAAASGDFAVCTTPALLTTKRGSDNYGHWMIEMLPKAFLAAKHLRQPGLRYVVPEIKGALGRVILQSLMMSGIGMAELLPLASTRPAYFEELIVVEGLTRHGHFISPRVMDCLDHIAAQVPAADPAPLYVSRRGSTTRHFTNEAEVIARMEQAGCRILDPLHASFSDQIAAFKGATAVAGIMGAGLTNLMFAPPGIPVVNFAPAGMPDVFYWMLANLRHQRYHEIRCAQSGTRRGPADWDTDIVLPRDDLTLATGLLA
jgi:capsular polysaccharide biosynthesis protein